MSIHARIWTWKAVQRSETETNTGCYFRNVCLAHVLLSFSPPPTPTPPVCICWGKIFGFKWPSGWVDPQSWDPRIKHYLMWIYFHSCFCFLFILVSFSNLQYSIKFKWHFRNVESVCLNCGDRPSISLISVTICFLGVCSICSISQSTGIFK